jgi:hypothetical protein
MYDVTDLRSTIIPKSDQLNADQLVGGPMTIKVTDVRTGSTDEQPIIVSYEGDAGRPFKPCKTMRRVLIYAWGPDGREWIGRSMTVYNDPRVRFGGDEVGGIRISAMSHIEREIQIRLSASKGKKALHSIAKIEQQGMTPAQIADWAASIEAAGIDELDAIKAEALAAATAVQDRDAFTRFSTAAKKRRAALSQTTSTEA